MVTFSDIVNMPFFPNFLESTTVRSKCWRDYETKFCPKFCWWHCTISQNDNETSRIEFFVTFLVCNFIWDARNATSVFIQYKECLVSDWSFRQGPRKICNWGGQCSYIRFRPRQFRLKLIVFTVCEPVYMNMGPFHYWSSLVVLVRSKTQEKIVKTATAWRCAMINHWGSEFSAILWVILKSTKLFEKHAIRDVSVYAIYISKNGISWKEVFCHLIVNFVFSGMLVMLNGWRNY